MDVPSLFLLCYTPLTPPARLRESTPRLAPASSECAGGDHLEGVRLMVRRKGELSLRKIDREWPHQVALPADDVMGANYMVIREYCRGLSVCPRTRTYWRDGRRYLAYCFATRSDAEHFQDGFNGEFVDPTNLGTWSKVQGGLPT